MKERAIGIQFSLLMHAAVFAMMWALSASIVAVSRPIEIDFGILEQNAPRIVERQNHVKAEPQRHREVKVEKTQPIEQRPVEKPQVITQSFTPSLSENAAPAAPPKSTGEERRSTQLEAKASPPSGSGPVDNVQFGSATGPNFVNRVMPVYPFVAKRMNKEGKVVLRLTIDEHGRLLNTEVIESAGYGFTEAALEAVKKSTYRPARKDGSSVLSRALLPVRFELTK